jgi:hypothetical protein
MMKVVLRRLFVHAVMYASIAVASVPMSSAALIDLTTLVPGYHDGPAFIAPGVPPGWTNVQATNLLSISNGSSLMDGPHNQLFLGDPDQLVAKVQIATSLTTDYSGNFGGFFLDTGNGFFGVTIGASALGELYGFNDGSVVSQALSGYTGGPLFLELVRSGSDFRAEYSTDGIAYNLLYQQSGLTGTSALDLTLQGFIAGETINFTNLDVVTGMATPEPASMALVGTGLTTLLAMCLRRSGSAG